MCFTKTSLNTALKAMALKQDECEIVVKTADSVENVMIDDDEDLGQEVDLNYMSEWRTQKLKWKKFFKNYETKLEREKGRKVLLKRINSLLAEPTLVDPKERMLLKRLKKGIRQVQSNEICETSKTNIASAYKKLQILTDKNVKKLKKQSHSYS